MKINYASIINSVPVLNKISEADLPVKTSINVYRLIKKIGPETETYNDLLKKIQEKYAIEKDDQKIIDPERMNEFFKEVQELDQTEVDIDFPPIDGIAFEDELIKSPNLQVKPRELFPIESFYKKEEKESTKKEEVSENTDTNTLELVK